MVELKNIGEVIAKERRAQKIKQKDLAKEVYVRSSAFSLYECGRRAISAETFIRVCLLLGLSIEDFVKGE